MQPDFNILANGREILCGTAPVVSFFPARLWNISIPFVPSELGSVTVLFSNKDLTITNISQSTHIFHNGQVDRTLMNTEDGWRVNTHGTGTNVRAQYSTINHAIDAANNIIGAPVFKYGVDLPMFLYITVDQAVDDWILH